MIKKISPRRLKAMVNDGAKVKKPEAQVPPQPPKTDSTEIKKIIAQSADLNREAINAINATSRSSTEALNKIQAAIQSMAGKTRITGMSIERDKNSRMKKIHFIFGDNA